MPGDFVKWTMLLIIFGAGASYDSVPFLSPGINAGEEEKFRPPWAKDLFGPRQYFLNAMRDFPKMLPIAPWLTQPPGGSSVEKVLQDLQDEARDYPERYCQLAVNYDRLLEKAMTSVGMAIDCISDYVAHDVFKVIKLHGSVHCS